MRRDKRGRFVTTPTRKKRYLQAKVWEHLKEHPGAYSRDLMAHFGWDRSRVRNLLQRLAARGLARHEPQDSLCRPSKWFAIGEGADCMWGVHPNSLANLKTHTYEEAVALLRNAGKGPRKDKHPPIAKPGCALEACWPVSMSSIAKAA